MKELCRGRVLIVDDDARYREKLEATFRRRNFIVRAAEGKEQELLESARQMVRDFRPHVTIMDLRLLTGPKHKADLSGVTLIDEPDFAFTRCVVYSAYLGNDHILARDLMDKPNVDDVVGRLEFLRLLSAVQNSFTRRCACCVEYLVKWPRAWKPESVTEALFGKESNVPSDIILDVLGRLFPKGAKLVLTTLEGATTTTSVARGHSVLLRALIPGKVPSVIKLAPRDRILKEVAAYEQYVDDSLGGNYHVQKKGGRIFWDVGAIRYRFIGSPQYPVRTLAAFYGGGADPVAILKPLRHFFEVVWRQHYTDTRSSLDESLFDAYDRAFNLRERLDELRGDVGESAFPGAPPELPDPLRWVLDHEPDSGAFTAHQAVTHGDLHGDNLFVEDDHAWAIDFERTGPGPILRDFVELEQDIATRLMQLDEDDFDTFFRFALALTTPRTVSDPLPVPGGAELIPDEVKKAGAVIAGLREIAGKVTGFQDMREYYWGLLLDALLGSSLVRQESLQRKRSMLLAAVISSRLENWNARWPPDWTQRRPRAGRGADPAPVPTGGNGVQRPQHHTEVFLSYNRRDLEVVKLLVRRLKNWGVNVWYDQDLEPGDPWVKMLEERLTHSKTCLICYGPYGLGEWQESERDLIIAYSRRGKLRAIPVRLPECKYEEDIPGLAGLSQACDLSGGLDNDEEFQKLLRGIYDYM